MRVDDVVQVQAAPSAVWDVTVAVEALPDITPTMTEVTVLDTGELAIGSEVRIKQPAQRPKVWTVTTLDDGRRFAWTTSSRGMSITARHDIVANDDGSTNALTVDLDGPLGKLLGPLLRRPIKRALVRENAGIKAAAEAASA